MDLVTPNSSHSAARSVPRHAAGQNTRPVLTPFTDNDWHAMRHGMHCLMYSMMGAHPDTVEGTAGTRFAVWAPNAREMSVICDANHWQHGRSPLARIDDGIWAGFIPGMRHGDTYKYSLLNSW